MATMFNGWMYVWQVKSFPFCCRRKAHQPCAMLNFSEKQQVGVGRQDVGFWFSLGTKCHAIFQWRPGNSSTVPVIFCDCIGQQLKSAGSTDYCESVMRYWLVPSKDAPSGPAAEDDRTIDQVPPWYMMHVEVELYGIAFIHFRSAIVFFSHIFEIPQLSHNCPLENVADFTDKLCSTCKLR